MANQAPLRVNQVSSTTGTAAYQLSPASSLYRNFRDQYANNQKVTYLATDETANYEIGIGTLTTGVIDQISRDTIILSSSSNTLVNWSTGYRAVYAWELAGSVYPVRWTASFGVDLTNWNTCFVFTGAGTGQAATLPALTSVPDGFSVTFKNSGTVPFSIMPAGSDQIENLGASVSYSVIAGASVVVTTDLGVWRLLSNTSVRSYTVATLPAAGNPGRRAIVTDATSPSFMGSLTGGGSTVTPVFDNGSVWLVG